MAPCMSTLPNFLDLSEDSKFCISLDYRELCDFLLSIQTSPTAWTYISPESVVLLSESLPAVRRPEGSTHQVLDHHSYVNQCVVVGRHHMLKQTSSHSFLFSLICSTAMIHIFIRYKVTKICFVCQYFNF